MARRDLDRGCIGGRGKPDSWFDHNLCISHGSGTVIEHNTIRSALDGIKVRGSSNTIVRNNIFMRTDLTRPMVEFPNASAVSGTQLDFNLYHYPAGTILKVEGTIYTDLVGYVAVTATRPTGPRYVNLPATSMNWTVYEPSRAPVLFPPGKVLFETSDLDDGTWIEADRLLSAGRCEDGRLELESGNTRLVAMIHSAAPYVAGLQEGQALRPVPLHEFIVRARQLEDPVCRLVSCDKALVLLTAVHFTKRPDLGGSLKLINPAHVLRVLAKEERDAGVALQHDGTRTLLFLHRGRPARLFFGDPAEDPREGSLEERLLLWAFDRVDDTRVEIFSDLRVAPDPDAGCSFVRLDEEAQPPPPATVFVSMDGREIRRRPFTPPEVIIGRDPRVDIFVDNLGVSGRHARLWWDRGGFMLADLGSSNGTMVNGRRIDTSPIHEEDEIRIGKFLLRLELEDQEPQVPETHLITTTGPGAKFWLASTSGRQEIDRDLLLGRGRGVDVAIRGWGVGSVHARLSPIGDELLLRCLNGRTAKVNGEKVGSARLEAGDDLEIGRSRFWIARDPVLLV